MSAGIVSPPLPDLDDVDEADVLQVWPGPDGYRWRYCCQGIGRVEVLADGGQGYSRLHDAVVGAARVAGVDAILLLASADLEKFPSRNGAVARVPHYPIRLEVLSRV